MTSLNDISLVTQVTVFGSRRAFDQLVRKYQSPVRRFFLYQTLGDSQLSDDLAQDTFIKAYTHIAQFRGTSSFKTWLMRIAYNVFYDYCRSEKQKLKGDELLTAGAEGTAARTEAASSPLTLHSSLKMDIHTALAHLKYEERTCITLQLIDGYAVDEIAGIMQMPTGTVKSHLSRGKEKLTTYLKQNGYDRK